MVSKIFLGISCIAGGVMTIYTDYNLYFIGNYPLDFWFYLLIFLSLYLIGAGIDQLARGRSSRTRARGAKNPNVIS